MARLCRVSVITVQRAYDDLEREGLIGARRGKGYVVREIAPDARRRTASARLQESLAVAIAAAHAEGLNRDDVREAIENVLGGGEDFFTTESIE